MLLAMYGGYGRNEYWSGMQVDEREGATTRLGKYMSCNHFKAITKALWYTNRLKPQYVDRFWEVHQMLEAWNERMIVVFSLSCVSCL